MLVSIDKIMRNTKDLDINQIVSDEKTFALTLRELQEIGESAKKLLLDKNLVDNSEIEWQKIIAFRNFVVHEYFSIAPGIIMEIIEEEIPALEENIIDLINEIKDKKYILQAISDTKKVLSKINRHESVSYLEKIENKIK
jgi:uncharacterized protein with HEPN domain